MFGIGGQVKKDQLNVLASQKRGEKHVFVLKDFETLGEVFNSVISKGGPRVALGFAFFCGFSLARPPSKTFQTGMRTFVLGDKSVTMCGVAQEVTQEDGPEAYTKPWHVTVTAGTVRVFYTFSISFLPFVYI